MSRHTKPPTYVLAAQHLVDLQQRIFPGQLVFPRRPAVRTAEETFGSAGSMRMGWSLVRQLAQTLGVAAAAVVLTGAIPFAGLLVIAGLIGKAVVLGSIATTIASGLGGLALCGVLVPPIAKDLVASLGRLTRRSTLVSTFSKELEDVRVSRRDVIPFLSREPELPPEGTLMHVQGAFRDYLYTARDDRTLREIVDGLGISVPDYRQMPADLTLLIAREIVDRADNGGFGQAMQGLVYATDGLSQSGAERAVA